uniref:CW domain-containing protein n=1 Tax=Caenorhabditis tropicalis TaxID=1561998 RepID=A0A1I7U3W6_9PELO
MLLLILLLIPTVSCEYEASMVKIYGKVVTEVDTVVKVLKDEDTCTNDCLEDSTCALAQMDSDGYCYSYNYSQITVDVRVNAGTQAAGFVVAFKTNQITCPAKFTTMGFSYYDLRNNANIQYDWEGTDSIWTLPKNPCPAPWGPFRRPDHSEGPMVICIQRFVTEAMDLTAASQYCTDKGYRFTGVVNAEELKFLMGDGGTEVGEIWIDGVTTSTSDYEKANYTFSDGYTETAEMQLKANSKGVVNSMCLYAYSETIFAAKCDGVRNDNKGVACGFAINQPSRAF